MAGDPFNEIVPGLFVGGRQAAQMWDAAGDERLCVLEKRYEKIPGICSKATYYVPIVGEDQPTKPNATSKHVAKRETLDACAAIIRERLAAGKKLLVHCGIGSERSPLTVAWYLVKSGHSPTLAEAYKFVAARRPQTANREGWVI